MELFTCTSPDLSTGEFSSNLLFLLVLLLLLLEDDDDEKSTIPRTSNPEVAYPSRMILRLSPKASESARRSVPLDSSDKHRRFGLFFMPIVVTGCDDCITEEETRG